MTPGSAHTILDALDRHLTSKVELTLYGRAALQLGFADPPKEFALTRDVDAVFWFGQAEFLLDRSNFWEAVDAANAALADQELFISHFFVEDQVALRAAWRDHRVRIAGPWKFLDLFRLGDLDLLLSKLMRDDPIDRADALFIVRAGGLTLEAIEGTLAAVRLPDSIEVREQFDLASRRLLRTLRGS